MSVLSQIIGWTVRNGESYAAVDVRIDSAGDLLIEQGNLSIVVDADAINALREALREASNAFDADAKARGDQS